MWTPEQVQSTIGVFFMGLAAVVFVWRFFGNE